MHFDHQHQHQHQRQRHIILDCTWKSRDGDQNVEMNFRCFAKSSQSETPSVPFPPENNLHNFRIATIIFSRTQMPYKRFLFGVTFFSNKKNGRKKSSWRWKEKRVGPFWKCYIPSESFNLSPLCGFPSCEQEREFCEQPILKLTQGVRLQRKPNFTITSSNFDFDL